MAPRGFPIEGDWYASKVGPGWGMYGLRDVLISLNEKTPTVHRCADISVDNLGTLILSEKDHLTYIGVDSQYFSSILIPQRKAGDAPWFSRSHPIRVGEYQKKNSKLTNASCRVVSVPTKLEPGGEITHAFHVFTGPKRPPLLQQYGLQDSVSYGWFWYVAIPMQWILHFFESYIVFNYGLAIILLTVVVRSCMFPISRKQALGAQKMQELQPELKAISEKYKKDPEALRHAQQELFRKHNYNPLSGCLPVFIQLPIFIGLYRALMVDVELRGASLLGPGVRWCSNLAAPDMLFYWGSFWDRIGWESFNTRPGHVCLGPYFNILPLVTIALFIVQQKMFMPPPTDDQAKMQQNMMTFMMVFMGLLFFKVASGLCIYFIASSLWGVAEKQAVAQETARQRAGRLDGTVDHLALAKQIAEAGQTAPREETQTVTGFVGDGDWSRRFDTFPSQGFRRLEAAPGKRDAGACSTPRRYDCGDCFRPGGVPRGIVRISGPQTGVCLQACCRRESCRQTERTAAIGTDLNLAPLAPLPADVYVWPSGRSYTGQPAAEIHTLGSPPLLEHLLETCCAAGARLAEPGEFTLRAFLSGRIDLTQAEGVLGTIDAVDPRSWTPPWSNWRADWPGRCRTCARCCWNCLPTSRPASISPTRTCRSSKPTSCRANCSTPGPRSSRLPSA